MRAINIADQKANEADIVEVSVISINGRFQLYLASHELMCSITCNISLMETWFDDNWWSKFKFEEMGIKALVSSMYSHLLTHEVKVIKLMVMVWRGAGSMKEWISILAIYNGSVENGGVPVFRESGGHHLNHHWNHPWKHSSWTLLSLTRLVIPIIVWFSYLQLYPLSPIWVSCPLVDWFK